MNTIRGTDLHLDDILQKHDFYGARIHHPSRGFEFVYPFLFYFLLSDKEVGLKEVKGKGWLNIGKV